MQRSEDRFRFLLPHQPSMTGLELTHKCTKRNSVIKTQNFPARKASGRASIALRRSAKAVPACRRWSPPASCTCTCSAAVDAILHSFKNAQVVILDNDRSLSRQRPASARVPYALRTVGLETAARISAASLPSNHLSADGPGSSLGLTKLKQCPPLNVMFLFHITTGTVSTGMKTCKGDQK